MHAVQPLMEQCGLLSSEHGNLNKVFGHLPSFWYEIHVLCTEREREEKVKTDGVYKNRDSRALVSHSRGGKGRSG